jgi:hypothetical protein
MIERISVLAGCLLACYSAGAAGPPRSTFSARRDYIGLYSQHVVVADVNGDGISDLIANDGGAVLVLFGNGDGTFRTGPTTLTGLLYAGSFVAVDINGDGKADLALAGNTPTGAWGIGVCLGNGDGTFQPAVFYPAGKDNEISYLVLGDFNGDHILDAATPGASGVWLFTGQGNGTFSPGVLAASLPSGSGKLATADFNGDHKLDLVVTMPAPRAGFAVLLGNGNGTFQAPQTFAEPADPFAVAAGNLSAHGHTDIALASATSSDVYLYFGNGAGSFAGPTRVYLPGASDIAIGDVNGDGIPDLIDPGVYIALGKGNGTFKPPQFYAIQGAQGTYNLALADLRNNGLTDIVTDSEYAVSVLLNQGKGKYEDGEWTPVSSGVGCGAAADFNRDGKPDLAVNTSSGVAILLGTGKASSPFVVGATMALIGADCVVTGDLNGDGIPDLLVPTATAVVAYLGNGDGTFTQKSSTPTPASGYLALGDFNRDGKLDFATSGNLLALGNGDGTFQTPMPIVSSPPVGGFSNIAAGDLNCDGWPDLILGVSGNSPLYVLLNNQHGGFSQSSATFGQGTLQVRLADLNKDGNLDLVLATFGGAWAYLGNGQGEFTESAEFPGPLISLGVSSIAMATDLNGDGIPDVGVLEGDTLAIFLGNGDGTFQLPFWIGTGPSPGDVLAENLHGQTRSAGLPDIVAPDFSGGVMVLINKTK